MIPTGRDIPEETLQVFNNYIQYTFTTIITFCYPVGVEMKYTKYEYIEERYGAFLYILKIDNS